MSVDDKAVIVTLPNYWDKTRFTVGIFDTEDTKIIKKVQYRNLVVEAIKTWEQILREFASDNHECNHLRNIEFDISENVTGTEDILVKWWFSKAEIGGETRFVPLFGKIQRSDVYIAKCHGTEIPILENPPESYAGIPILRTPEQIKSVALHEFGHVLGLGHCSYHKDIMHTGSFNQDMNRKISFLDLRVICQVFNTNTHAHVNVPFSIPKSDWASIQ